MEYIPLLPIGLPVSILQSGEATGLVQQSQEYNLMSWQISLTAYLGLPGTSDIPSSESSTSSHPIPNNPLLIQELLIEPSEEDCVKVVNVEESDQSPAIELAHLYEKMKFAEIRTIRAKQDEIMSWYCYRRYFEKRHSEILPEILENGVITNKKAYELVSGQIYDEMLQYLSGVSRVNLRKKTQLTKPIYMLFNEIGEDMIMQIKTYSANKLSKLTVMQIDTIKTTLREKNSRTHVTSEIITGDATAPVESMVSVPNSLGDSKVIGPDNSPPIPPAPQVSHVLIKISKFPEDRNIIYEAVRKRFPFLSWTKSITKYRDHFEYTNSEAKCPACTSIHTHRGIWGDWTCQSKDNFYYLMCPWDIHQNKKVKIATQVC
ncbi:13600_t:CDS:2 [Funneliformis mosseae]|uniref:13600_t:CDS:1 n=1 Tax=Funneliformis mosseae TaxID=27381 RepID=A0A9N9G7R9_FUNMO|nr:13600_t:CDS:2 [Funneliformis mosseae]